MFNLKFTLGNQKQFEWYKLRGGLKCDNKLANEIMKKNKNF